MREGGREAGRQGEGEEGLTSRDSSSGACFTYLRVTRAAAMAGMFMAELSAPTSLLPLLSTYRWKYIR